MSIPLFLGCTLIAFGPIFAFFYRIVLKRPQLTILAVASSFFWLLSLLLSSLVCSIPSLIEITWLVAVLSVLIQEGFRYLFVKLYFYAFEKVKFKLAGTRDILPLNDLSAAIASGVGTGTIYTLIMYGQVGSYTLTEPGTIYREICPSMSLYLTTALLCCFFSLLHVMLMVLAFHAYRRQSQFGGAIVLILHMAASFISFRTQAVKNGCVQSILGELLLVVISGFYLTVAVKRSGGVEHFLR